MAQSDTVTRILDVAEELFAEKGYAETSLRSITTKADVNLAAVNYHFGSKKELIQAIFARFLDPFTRRLNQKLDTLEQEGRHEQIETVLQTIAITMVEGLEDSTNNNKLSVFLRLLGLAYSQSQGHIRKFLRERYMNTYLRVLAAIKAVHPELSANDLFWRIHFAVGAAVFSLGSIEVLRALAIADTGEDNNVSNIMEKLIPFITAGMDS
jgi:AcrR family transcriptional regulator